MRNMSAILGIKLTRGDMHTGNASHPSTSSQPVRLAGSFRCWFVKKYCWLVCVREKYCSGWKFTIVYDKPQPNEQAANLGVKNKIKSKLDRAESKCSAK